MWPRRFARRAAPPPLLALPSVLLRRCSSTRSHAAPLSDERIMQPASERRPSPPSQASTSGCWRSRRSPSACRSRRRRTHFRLPRATQADALLLRAAARVAAGAVLRAAAGWIWPPRSARRSCGCWRAARSVCPLSARWLASLSSNLSPRALPEPARRPVDGGAALPLGWQANDVRPRLGRRRRGSGGRRGDGSGGRGGGHGGGRWLPSAHLERQHGRAAAVGPNRRRGGLRSDALPSRYCFARLLARRHASPAHPQTPSARLRAALLDARRRPTGMPLATRALAGGADPETALTLFRAATCVNVGAYAGVPVLLAPATATLHGAGPLCGLCSVLEWSCRRLRTCLAQPTLRPSTSASARPSLSPRPLAPPCARACAMAPMRSTQRR